MAETGVPRGGHQAGVHMGSSMRDALVARGWRRVCRNPIGVSPSCVKQPALEPGRAKVAVLMDLEFEGAPARGLRRYVRLVADALGLGPHGYCVQLERPVGIYLALDGRLSRFPTRDVALTWDEEHGWAAGVETHLGEDLIVLAYLGIEVLPPPRTVARFVEELFADHFPGQPDPPTFRSADDADDLPERLAGYAIVMWHKLDLGNDGTPERRPDASTA